MAKEKSAKRLTPWRGVASAKTAELLNSEPVNAYEFPTRSPDNGSLSI